MTPTDRRMREWLRDARDARDALVAHDPGWVRLRTAARATLSAVLGYAGVFALSLFTGVPLFHVVLGTVVGLLGGVAINDDTAAARRLSTLLLPLPGAASMALAGVLAPHGQAAEAGLVPVIFAAMYARKAGARGFAFGFAGFVLYFASLIFARRFGLSADMFLSLPIGAAAAYVTRFWVFRDVLQASSTDLLAGVEARLRLLLGEVARSLRRPGRDGRALRIRVVELNEAVLLLDERLDRAEPTERVFEVELAAQRLAVSAGRYGRRTGAAGDPAAAALLAEVRAARRTVGAPGGPGRGGATGEADRHRQRPPTAAAAAAPEGEREVRAALAALVAAAQGIRAAAGDLPTAATARRPSPPGASEDAGGSGEERAETPGRGRAPHPGEDESEAGAGGARRSVLDPVVRQALQAALAGALAIAGGELISPQRWYWAAIATFVVFTGTSSRGDVLVKGWQRVLGTLAGAVAGVLIATAVHGDLPATTGALIASVFLAFYFFQLSYAVMIAWITVMLALLYGLLGFFSVQLLELRLLETAYGVVVGGLVAYLFLPSPTRHHVADASADLLRHLADLLEGVGRRATGRADTQRILADLRAMDGDLQQLRQLAGPITRWTPGGRERAGMRHWLRALIALRLDAHRLADLGRQPAGDASGEGYWRAVADAAEDVAGRLRDLAGALVSGAPVSWRGRRPWLRQVILEEVRDRPEGPRAASADGDPPAEQAARVLQRLDWAVSMLAADLGLPEPPGGRTAGPAGAA